MERIRPQINERPQDHNVCSYCRDDVARKQAWLCDLCGLVLHHECLQELESCPTPGCGGETSDYHWRERTERKDPQGSEDSAHGGLAGMLLALAVGGAPLGAVLAYVTRMGEPGALSPSFLAAGAGAGAIATPAFLLLVLGVSALSTLWARYPVRVSVGLPAVCLLVGAVLGNPLAGLAVGAFLLALAFRVRSP